MIKNQIINETINNKFYNFENDRFLDEIMHLSGIEKKDLFPTSFNLERKFFVDNTLNNKYIYSTIENNIEKNVPIKKPNFRKLCNSILQNIGFNLNSKGTILIVEAILHLYKNNHDTFHMEEIYDLLGNRHSLKPQTIKANINNSLNSMLSNPSNLKILDDYFSEHDGRIPNSKYFITMFVYELRRHFPPRGYNRERIEKILYSI